MREGNKIFPCGGCGREVQDDDEAIFCESGCEQWYHRSDGLLVSTTSLASTSFLKTQDAH